MDESAVQTALCVIGHPIAGNPSQFCILRTLTALGLEWQCLSFDVPPESLPAAVSGIDVLGFAGALIAAPHHSTAAALLQLATDDTTLPSPALQAEPAAWIDGLQRGADDRWVGCNFLGEAFAELLAGHQQKLGQPLPHCVFLGDADTFAAAVAPYQQHLPPSCFVLEPSGLRRLTGGATVSPSPEPALNPATDTAPPAASPAAEPSSAAPPADPAEHSDPEPLAAPTAQPPATNDAADEPLNPLQGPVLLIRPHRSGSVAAEATTKKGSAKGKASPQLESLIESTLQQLHPDSLQVDLAPEGAPWQVIRGHASTVSAVISPLDLEVNRIAAAIRCWTGCDPDRALLAEAIEEYLEI